MTLTLVESSMVTQSNFQGYLYVALKCIGIIFQSVSKTSETIHWHMVSEVGFKTKSWYEKWDMATNATSATTFVFNQIPLSCLLFCSLLRLKHFYIDEKLDQHPSELHTTTEY